ncbi:MAG TPA: DMT family transporter [Bryobacteraceae bacterium]|nr:DMT family transporter [Bryobacteraceae bacterium]
MNGAAVLYALILLMVVFWSGNYIAGKIALREFSPMLLAGLRIVFAGVTILPVYLWERLTEPRLTEPRPSGSGPRDAVRPLMLGLFGVTLNQVLFVVGLSRTSVAHAAILIGLTPIQVLIIAGLRGQERITARKAFGMAIALGGVAMLKAFEPATGAGATWIGDAVVLLAGLCFALFTVFGKEVTAQYSTITMNTYAYVGGAVALLPLTLWEAAHQPLANVSAGAWLAAIYMALFPSVIAYLIYYHALAHMTASRVSAFSYLQPVFASIMGVAILGETLGTPVIAGGVAILGGVYLAERG